jgi:hypothetical protein
MRVGALLIMAAALFALNTGCSGDGVAESTDALADVAPGGDLPGDTLKDAAPESPVPVEPHAEQSGDFTVVWLRGTPYQMGKQHGELLHDVIEEAIAFVMADPVMSALPLLAKDAGIIDLALANSYPDILDECKGLVDATQDVGFTMDLCLTLNFGDVMLDFLATGTPESGPGCTGAIAAGNATADGKLLHSRNLDWGSMDIAIVHQHPVIFVRQPKDAIPHVYVGFPLNLSPYTGMNLAGISIGSHEGDPATVADLSPEGRSHVQMVGQLLKNATSLAEAQAFIQGEKHMSVEALVVAAGMGQEGAVFEMAGSGVGVRHFDNDIVYASNHFVHPDMAGRHAAPAMGSKMRFERLTQLLSQDGDATAWGTLDPKSLATVMRDTTHPVTGESPSLEELADLDWDNDWAIGANGPMHLAIFQPETGLFWVAAGALPIHTRPYRCFSLKELLGYANAPACPYDIQ